MCRPLGLLLRPGHHGRSLIAGKVGLPSLLVLWGHDLLSSQSGLNHSQVGPPWMNVTGLIPCPEKQKANPQTQPCHAWGWDGQEDAGEPHSQGPQHLPRVHSPRHELLLSSSVEGPDSDQPGPPDLVPLPSPASLKFFFNICSSCHQLVQPRWVWVADAYPDLLGPGGGCGGAGRLISKGGRNQCDVWGLLRCFHHGQPAADTPGTCFSPPPLTLSDYETECETALCTSNYAARSCRCRLQFGQAVCEPAAPTGQPSPQPRDKAAVSQRHKGLAVAPCHVASEIFIFGNEKPLVLWCPWHPQSQAAFLRQSQG